MHWEVQLTGDSADLRMLAEACSTPDLTIEAREDEHVLRAKQFAGLKSAGEVRSRAEKITSVLSAYARIKLGAYTPVGVGAVYQVKDDGGRGAAVLIEPGELRVRGMPLTMKVTRADGSVEINRAADPVPGWLDVAMKDDAIAKALRLRDNDKLSWGELYRIYEVMEADVGRSTIVSEGWLSDNAITLFMRTANSVTAAGDEARHGKETTQPPKKPMTLPAARTLIDHLLSAWIEHKR